MGALKEFGKAAVTPAFGAIGAVSALLGFTDTEYGAMKAGGWLLLGYVMLVLFFTRLWWDQSQRTQRAEKQLVEIKGGVTRSLEVQEWHIAIGHPRSVTPAKDLPPDVDTLGIVGALFFEFKMLNDSDLHYDYRVLESAFTVQGNGVAATDAFRIASGESATIHLRSKNTKNFSTGEELPLAVFGPVEGVGHFTICYGGVDGKWREMRRAYLWNAHVPVANKGSAWYPRLEWLTEEEYDRPVEVTA